MALVSGVNSTPTSSQNPRTTSTGVLTSMLVDVPVAKPGIAPVNGRAGGGAGQRHVPIMRTMQQDQSAALTAVKAVDQAHNKHPEAKKGGFFSSFLHHDASVSTAPVAPQTPHTAPQSVSVPIVQASTPTRQPIRMPSAMPPRPPAPPSPTPAQVSRVVPVAPVAPPKPVPPSSQSVPVAGQKVMPPLKPATPSMSVNSARPVPAPPPPVKPPLPITPNPVPAPPLKQVASPVLQRPVAPKVSVLPPQATVAQKSLTIPQQRVVSASVPPSQLQPNKIPNISTTPQVASQQSPQVHVPQATSVSRSPVTPQPRMTSSVQYVQGEGGVARSVVTDVRQVTASGGSQPIQTAPSELPQGATSSRIQAHQVDVTRAGVPQVAAQTPKVFTSAPSPQQHILEASSTHHAVVATKDTHPAILSQQASRAISVSVPQVIAAKVQAPISVSAPNGVTQNPVSRGFVPPAPAAGTVSARPSVSLMPMQNAPFLPPLSKAPKTETAPTTTSVQTVVRPIASVPAQVQSPVVSVPPSSSHAKKLVPQSVQLASVVEVVPSVAPPPPPSPSPVTAPVHPAPTNSTVVHESETHGTLPGRVTAAAAEERHEAKQPLSQVFPSKQEVVDGAHAALVRNGTLTEGGVSGAEERAMNYVDTRLEDENLFGGVNKGTTQVVWSLVKDLEVASVLAGDLPTEEMSREEHVSHTLHEQAYLMVRDVAKKLSLTPKSGETVQVFLVRAAEAGPLF